MNPEEETGFPAISPSVKEWTDSLDGDTLEGIIGVLTIIHKGAIDRQESEGTITRQRRVLAQLNEILKAKKSGRELH